jgi:hypothetical protein
LKAENSRRSENSDIPKLYKEISRLKRNELKLKDELRSVIAQLEQQPNPSNPNERLLQLRGRFVMTIQDDNETDNAQLILQVKNMENIYEEEEEDNHEF